MSLTVHVQQHKIVCLKIRFPSNLTSLPVPAAETVSYLNRSSPTFSSRLLWRSSWDKQRQKSGIQGWDGSQNDYKKKKKKRVTAVPRWHLSATRPGLSSCPCCEPADRSQRCQASLSPLGQSAVTWRCQEVKLEFCMCFFYRSFLCYLTNVWLNVKRLLL